ncbi:hypothetical protein GGS26DRAFT_104387 [Hypomontagnella submonticulosa]|nr:hypothetical protein GGS26DRAFT_104387 [Hypomontagnella submonticulosa]
MAFSKEEEAKGEQLPSYEAVSDPSTSHVGQVEAPVDGPTTDSPFNFPSDSNLPPYSAPSTQQRPIAIPQITANPTAPFLDAFSQTLLRHGITKETWSAFLRTLSGFLAATVSEKAISHAAEIGQTVGDVPKRFGKETLAHAKATGHAITDSAKKGNYIGAARNVIGGAIALPVATAIRAVGATVSLPFAALGAVTSPPKTPKERAVAYAAAANLKWLNRRGLQASLLDTAELCQSLGLSVEELLRIARGANDGSAEAQIKALGTYIAEVEARIPGPLELGAGTFWLVVTEKGEDRAYPHPHPHDGEKRRGRLQR